LKKALSIAVAIGLAASLMTCALASPSGPSLEKQFKQRLANSATSKPTSETDVAYRAIQDVRVVKLGAGGVRIIMPNRQGVLYRVSLGKDKGELTSTTQYRQGTTRPGESPTLRYATYRYVPPNANSFSVEAIDKNYKTMSTGGLLPP
jgi:hypothetical protein